MRKVANITVRRKRIGDTHCSIRLPENDEIVDLGEEVFKVYGAKSSAHGGMYEKEFSMGTMDGTLDITVKVFSTKPFKPRK